MTQRRIYKHIPFILLILAQLTVGLFTFHDYGLTWDEPYFYGYGDALGYAYTPANWFRPDFDLSKSYGPSGDDHKNRGPAYLVLAREPVQLLKSLGVDEPSAWHLFNFLTFLLGVYLVYRLSLRWMGEWAAFGAAALFSTQPLLWGHAFINPKDMPFLVFFTGALLFGFEMVDTLNDKTKNGKQKILRLLLAAFFLGIATSIRVLAPLAGVLVVIYAVIKHYATRNISSRSGAKRTQHATSTRAFIFHLSSFILLSILIMLASWPYLWESPLKNFFQVFLFMSDNPTGLQVLFNGQAYRAFDLPRRYLPTFLALTLTEPVWPLFILGLGVATWKLMISVRSKITRYSTATPSANSQQPTAKNQQPISNHQLPITNYQLPTTDYWLTLLAFLIPFTYVITLQPPMYDGFRHFLFIAPPIFGTIGLGFDGILTWLQRLALRLRPQTAVAPLRATSAISWLYAILILALLTPNLFAISKLHPYEYTYYNSFIGGTRGAFRTYETDYWLTCYKEAVQRFEELVPLPATLYIHREAYIAAPYALNGLIILDERGNLANIHSGDYVLVNTRTNEDNKTFHDAPILLEIQRDGATFCLIKRVP